MEPISVIILACVGSGALTALVTGLLTRKKAKAEAEKIRAEADKTAAEAKKVAAEAGQIVVDAAVKMVAELRAEVIRLTVRVDALEKENEKLTFQLEAVRRGTDAQSW